MIPKNIRSNPLKIKDKIPAGQKNDARNLRNYLENFTDYIDDTIVKLKTKNLKEIKNSLYEEIEIYDWISKYLFVSFWCYCDTPSEKKSDCVLTHSKLTE